MDTIKYIQDKFQVDLNQKSPIKLPIERFKGLSVLFKELGFRAGAEIGVDRGRFTKWMFAKNKGVKIYCVDPWMAYSEYVEKDEGIDQSSCDASYAKAMERLASFNCEFIKKTSMEAVKDFEDNSLDFVFIDANHTFQYVVNDIAEWEKKVRPGGIVSGHDFWRSIELKKVWIEAPTYIQRLKLCQVKDAVEGWVYANRIKPLFITNDYCWLYVKI